MRVSKSLPGIENIGKTRTGNWFLFIVVTTATCKESGSYFTEKYMT